MRFPGWLQKAASYIQSQQEEEAGSGDSFATQLGRHILSQSYDAGDFPLGVLGDKFGPTRNTAIAYVAMNRCVTLIAAVAASLIAGGNLQVHNRMGGRVDNRRTGQILDVLCYSPDMGDTPMHSFIEDAMADYCLDGNGLIVPQFNYSDRLLGFKRYQPWDANLIFATRTKGKVYQMLEADVQDASLDYVASREVIHCRWPRLLRYGFTASTRQGFALAPVVALREALGIGLQSDRYVGGWFKRGSKNGLHVNWKLPPESEGFTPDQRKELASYVKTAVRNSEPLVTFNAESTKIDDTPQDSESGELRNFQVQEIARFYGIPLPLLSVSIRQWGAAVNEQIGKLGYRWGMKTHLDRLLSAMALPLLKMGERFVVDPTELVRGDAEGMKDLIMALQGDAQRAPVATGPELRHIAGLPRDPDGAYLEAPMQKPVEGQQANSE